MKKLISLICAVALLTTATFAAFVSPVSAAGYTEIALPEFAHTEEGSEVGEVVTVSVGDTFPSNVILTGTATAVENPSGIGEIPAMQVSGDFRVAVNGHKGGQGVMIYIKAPDNDTSNHIQIYLLKNVLTQQYQYGYADWFALERGKSTWDSYTIDNYGPTLPARFEGYLYIPFTGLTLSAEITADDYITGMQVWFATNGGEQFIMSAPIVVIENQESTDKVVCGETTYNLFADGTGVGFEETEEFDEYADHEQIEYGTLNIPEIKTLRMKKGLAVGSDINEASYNDWSDNIKSTTVDSIVGITKYPSIEINKETGAVDSDLLCSFYPDTDMSDGGESVIFYLKMPTDSPDNIIKILFNFTTKLGISIPAYVYNGISYAMPKGETSWQDVSINAYYAELPAGFEGFIKIPYSSLYSPNADRITDEFKLNTMHMYIPNTSGNTITVSAPMLITKSGDAKDGAFINGNTKVARNMFTGEKMEKDDLIDPLLIGDVLKTMPAPTTDKMINDPEDEDVTTTTAKITWEESEGASSYRVDLFKKVLGADGLEFIYVDTKTVTGTQHTFTGLSKNTNYAVMVTALESSGGEMAIYDYANIRTLFDDDGKIDGDPDEDPIDDVTNDEDQSDDVVTGDNNIVVLLALLSALSALVIVRKKRIRQ